MRYYNPITGSWISRDPIGERGGLNLYGFLRSNPISNIDYLGLDCLTCGSDEQIIPPPPAIDYNQLEGFSICKRNFDTNDDDCNCLDVLANLNAGRHTYVQHVDRHGGKWGWGFGDGGTGRESAFNADSCRRCTIAQGWTENDVKECIENFAPRRDYMPVFYDCKDWAEEAAAACGLSCE